jgi:HEAT repeat protein
MRLREAIGVFACAAVWRTTGLKAAGRPLVRALGASDETVRNIAGILLVRAGKRAEPLLQEALHKRENLPLVLTILADLGSRNFQSEMEAFSRDGDPQIARAAQAALRTLRIQR